MKWNPIILLNMNGAIYDEILLLNQFLYLMPVVIVYFYGVEMEIWCSDDLINVFFFIICLVGNYVAPMDIMMSTFDAYWNRCKDSNLYIVGNTEQLCQKRSITIWTGLRKYKIGIRIKRIKHYFKFYATFNNFYLNLHM